MKLLALFLQGQTHEIFEIEVKMSNSKNLHTEDYNKVIINYNNLKVFKLSFQKAMQIFELSRSWPQEEKYALTNQIRRSSRSVCGNMAEAWRKRRYPAYFVSKLSDSDAEAAETEVWLDFALKCGYLSEDTHIQMRRDCDYICRMLYLMMKNPQKWILKNT